MSVLPTVAIMYDFDKTLSPKDMQEYAFIPSLGMEAKAFWELCNAATKLYNMDQILSYMYVMIEQARGKRILGRAEFNKLGKSVQLCEGVNTWFARINKYAAKKGIIVEHYIISSGLKEIIEGTSIASEFKEIYAAEFCYNEYGEPFWPAMAVNYTSKTQFLFRINKGVESVTEHKKLNQYTHEDDRRIPFRNMIYIGDGLTDVPCMKLVKVNGGFSVAVYNEDTKMEVTDMLLQGRVDYIAPTNYKKDSEIEQIVLAALDQIAAVDKTMQRHAKYKQMASETE